MEMTVFLLECEGCRAVQKRKEKGVLHGLYQYPNVAEKLAPDEALALAAEWSCSPAGLNRSSEYKHIFSHVEWHMTGYALTIRGDGPAELEWVDAAGLAARSVPSAFARYYEEAKRELEMK